MAQESVDYIVPVPREEILRSYERKWMKVSVTNGQDPGKYLLGFCQDRRILMETKYCDI